MIFVMDAGYTCASAFFSATMRFSSRSKTTAYLLSMLLPMLWVLPSLVSFARFTRLVPVLPVLTAAVLSCTAVPSVCAASTTSPEMMTAALVSLTAAAGPCSVMSSTGSSASTVTGAASASIAAVSNAVISRFCLFLLTILFLLCSGSGPNQTSPVITDEVLPMLPQQGFLHQRIVFRPAVLDQCPLHGLLMG